MDMSTRTELVDHIRNHVSYPISKQELIRECNNMSHVPSEGQMMVQKLPDRTFRSADEVLGALNMPSQ